MARLNIDRQKQLEPARMQHAIDRLTALGLTITSRDKVAIKFLYKGETITFWPYSGWHSGKGIKDGRGLENLLKQLK